MQTLFVDFDGTICHDRFWRSLPQTEHDKVQEILFKQNNEMVVDWMKGKYSSEDINQFVATKTGIDDGVNGRFFKMIVKQCVSMIRF